MEGMVFSYKLYSNSLQREGCVGITISACYLFPTETNLRYILSDVDHQNISHKLQFSRGTSLNHDSYPPRNRCRGLWQERYDHRTRHSSHKDRRGLYRSILSSRRRP